MAGRVGSEQEQTSVITSRYPQNAADPYIKGEKIVLVTLNKIVFHIMYKYCLAAPTVVY